MASGSWRLAASLAQYRAEVNARWPKRDKRSDGTIGDAEHATRNSDHNPWLKSRGVGVVRAVDIDKDLLGPGTDTLPAERAPEAEWLAEHVRKLGKARDPRLVGGGYVIWRGRIASEANGFEWTKYKGENPHRHHLHVSVSRNPAGFDSSAPWGITAAAKPDAVTLAAPVVRPIDGRGFLAMLNDAEQRELLDGVRECRKELTQRLGSRAPGTNATDTLLGWALNADAKAAAANAKLDKLVETLLNTPLDNVMTFKDGKAVKTDDRVTVGYLLRRASEGSGARQALEALRNATTAAAAKPAVVTTTPTTTQPTTQTGGTR